VSIVDLHGTARDFGGAATYTEHLPWLVFTPNATITDIDNASLAWLSARIVNNVDGSNERLLLTTNGFCI